MIGEKPSRLAESLSWLLLALGIGYFAWAAYAVAYSYSMDYAVVVDMVRNMAAGEDFPVFFYGQAYMGSLEPAVSALVCAVFGPSPFCVCLGTALLGIATLIVTLLVGKRLAGPWGGFFSLLLAITGGFYWVHFMVSPRGGYALATLLVVSSLSLASLGSFADPDSGRIRLGPTCLLGFCAGLAFWNFWLALPAFAAAGLVVLLRLRHRLFSIRFLLPALLSFFAGSAPWWVWAWKNGLGALNMGGGGLPASGMRALNKMLLCLIPQFYSTASSFAAFWRTPLPWVLIVILLISLAAICLQRRPDQLLFLLATVLYAGLFVVIYARTPFGTMGVARYLVPFVPVFSVLSGSALGSLMTQKRTCRGLPSFLQPLLVSALAASYLLFVALPAVRISVQQLLVLHAQGREWRERAGTILNSASLAEAAFADFSLFGYNWMSDRRLCFVSPSLWRYDPYLERLEAASRPAVINNLFSFRSFCKASGGRFQTKRMANLLVTHDIAPPEETAELPAEAALRISAIGGSRADHLLLDDNLATGIRFRGKNGQEPYLDLEGDCISNAVGVSILVDPQVCPRGWSVDLLDAFGNVVKSVSDNPHKGWFWSGPRPYLFGPEARWTIRWRPNPAIARIRLNFASRRPGAPIFIPDLRLLSSSPLPSTSVQELKAAADKTRQEHRDVRIHASRWLARQLGADPDPSLQLGVFADDLRLPEVCRFVTLDETRPHLLVFHDPGIAQAAAETLRSCGWTFQADETGGHHLLTVAPRQSTSSQTSRGDILRFVGGRLLRDAPLPPNAERITPRDIRFGRTLALKGHSKLPVSVSAGESLVFETIWQFSPDHTDDAPLVVYLHGLQNGRIIAQDGKTIQPTKAKRPADNPYPAPLAFHLAVPGDIPAGDISLALCVKKGMRFSPRLTPDGDGLPIERRKAILGQLTVVDPTFPQSSPSMPKDQL